MCIWLALLVAELIRLSYSSRIQSNTGGSHRIVTFFSFNKRNLSQTLPQNQINKIPFNINNFHFLLQKHQIFRLSAFQTD